MSQCPAKNVVLNTTWFVTHALTGDGCRSMSYCCEHMFMINITHCLVYTGLCSAKLGGVHDAGRGGRATGALDGQQVFRRQGEGKGGEGGKDAGG